MITIRTLPNFDNWFYGIKDGQTRIRLSRRLERVQRGQFGDVKPMGEGVFEMREHFGSGWRMYYVQRGAEVIVMLGGGDKSSQDSDIAKAKHLAAILEINIMSEKISVSSLPVFDMANILDSDEMISEYLSQVFADGDSDELIRALGYIAKAKGMAMVAQESGLGRESLYKALSEGSKPRFDTIFRVIKALGIRLHAEPV